MSRHGVPNFKVGDKSFAMFCINHHGDGRVALWLRSPEGVQQLDTQIHPAAYFVPPYVGPSGWLGMDVIAGPDWKEITARVREAYENIAPAALLSRIDDIPAVAPPNVPMAPEDIDLMLGERPQKVLAELDERSGRLPETSRAEGGSPVWKAGKKVFARAVHFGGRLKLQFRVGVEQQSFLAADPRYSIPMYYGSSGWIDLDVHDNANWEEIDGLLETSYRHFALKRMLKALDG